MRGHMGKDALRPTVVPTERRYMRRTLKGTLT